MTALLTDNLPLLAGAPNGIKKLRELILELAVRGKLVPQDPSDEPASELLKRIAEEKARLVAEAKIKKQKPLEAISEDEKPFALPMEWEWTRLGSIASLENGDRSSNYPNKSQLVDSGIPFINAGHLQNGLVDLQNMNFITRDCYDRLRAGKVQDEDILFCLRGSLGKSAIVRGVSEGAIASSLVIVRMTHSFSNEYLMGYFSSPLAFDMVKRFDNGTAQPNLSAADLNRFLVPLPPLTEQHRIVAKVDELMALCDRLEAQQADAESAHAQLVQALLDSLPQARDAEDFAQNWQRLAKHFHTLFTTESSIDALKQTLLQLAVMGKLVPQDPSDEPASELLERIAEEKEQLVNEGKIRKQKPLEELSEKEKPYELPPSWIWTRLGSQVLESGAGWSPSCEARPRDGDEWGVLKVSAVSWGTYRPEENKALPANLEARPEHEVAKGDFLVSRANTAELVARSVVAEETPRHLMLSDKIVRLKLTSMCARRYMNLANSAPLARRYYSQVAGGTSSVSVHSTTYWTYFTSRRGLSNSGETLYC
uniref:restriction endonuclease subunit S n=1 Tax=Stutzerimonas stutzeri TaxID=316 RepID=UPI000368B6D5